MILRVIDLIRKLEEMPPDARVFFWDNTIELNHTIADVVQHPGDPDVLLVDNGLEHG